MSGIRAVLIDLDGNLWYGGKSIPGAPDALRQLQDSSLQLFFITNTDSRDAAAIQASAKAMQFDLPLGQITTSVDAAVSYVDDHEKKRCFCLTAPEIAARFELVTDDHIADFVVLADPRHTFNYDQFNLALRHLKNGAKLIATQKGKFCMNPDGVAVDTGSVMALFEYASGQKAQIMGKPSPALFEACMKATGTTPEETLIIGDDVMADIQGGKDAGLKTVLVRTGRYTQQPEMQEKGESIADAVIDSFSDLPKLLEV